MLSIFSRAYHYLNWIVCFVLIELYEFFKHFVYSSFTRHIICKYLLLFSRLPFNFVDSFHNCAEAFQFNVVLFVYFYVFALSLSVIPTKMSLRLMSRSLPLISSSRSLMFSDLTINTLKERRLYILIVDSFLFVNSRRQPNL